MGQPEVARSTGEKVKFLNLDRSDFVIPRTLAIEMNGVKMDLTNAPDFVNRYHINIVKVKRNKEEKDATRGFKQEYVAPRLSDVLQIGFVHDFQPADAEAALCIVCAVQSTNI